MERSRVEDIKKKFECLQSQSPTSINVNKTNSNYNKSYNNKKPSAVSCLTSTDDSQNIRPSNSSFVGRGNIKRSHAFRADKPLARNYSGNDASPSIDTTKENLFDSAETCHLSPCLAQNGSQESNSNKVLYDLKQKKHPITRKAIKLDNVHNDRGLLVSQKWISGNVPLNSKYQLSDSQPNHVKEEIRVSEELSQDLNPKATYSTVVKSRKSKCKNVQESPLNVSDRVNLCDTSANIKNINLDNSKFKTTETSSTVKSIVKSVEQRNVKKLSIEKLKSPELLHLNDSVSTNDCLSNTLKAALSAPLPSGPPPKKPPRTFAHSLSTGSDDKVLKKQVVLKSNSASGLKQSDDAVAMSKPVRSKTESQIMLKKLENYLLTHQENSISINSKSLKKDKSCNLNESISTPKLEKQHLTSFKYYGNSNEILGKDAVRNADKLSVHRAAVPDRQTNSSSSNNNSSNCFDSLNCTRQPIYDSPIEKQSNFFVTIPKRLSVEGIDSDCVGQFADEFRRSSYGTIRRSASEEHIYAEPEKTEDCVFNGDDKISASKFKCATISERHGKLTGINSRPSLLLPPVTNYNNKTSNVQLLKTTFEPAVSSKELISQENGSFQYGLHYMCTPINDTSSFNNTNKNNNTGNSFKSRLNTSKDFLNEAVNANVRLGVPITDSTSTEHFNNVNTGRLHSLSVVSDCSQPRRIRASSSESPDPDIDKHRIHLLLSEAYGKIKPDKKSRAMLSLGTKAGSTGDVASGSDSDCSSIVSTPDDPCQSFVLPSSSALPSVSASGSGALSIRSAKDREQITAERKGYVRRVSRRLTSVRRSPNLTPDKFSHLFECLILVGLDLNSARCKVPYLKSKFPENISSPPGIESLCFPDADDWPPEPDSGQSYIQILTDSNGVRKYSYCRRVQPEDAAICLPLVYCIITSFKSNSFYDKVLIDLESRHGHQSDAELSKFIQQLYNCPFPAPGQTFSIQHQINSSESTMIDVYKRPLDSREEDTELAKLLTVVKLSVFLKIFATLLHERKVILVSDSISKLSICIEGLQSALYPFYWQHTVIPILPSNLMDICEAPTPYLIGIIKPKLSDLPFSNVDLDLVVDIDKDVILNSKGDEGWILPSRLSRGLRSALQLSIDAAHSNICAANIIASEAIMRLFVEMIGHYRVHIIVSNDTRKREFQRESFVRNGASRSMQLFLEWFTETAMFNAFIESRLERSSESRGVFEQRCSEYIEENEMSHPLMKKAINKTVKSLGDRFKDWAALS